MRRILVRAEFRLHHVTTLAAELNRVHVLDGAIGALRSDDDVKRTGNSEKDRKLSNVTSPVGVDQKLAPQPFHMLPRQENSEGNQDEAQNENDRNQNENDNPNVWIAGVPPKLDRQNEQPGKAGGRDQRRPQHGDPVTSKQGKD